MSNCALFLCATLRGEVPLTAQLLLVTTTVVARTMWMLVAMTIAMTVPLVCATAAVTVVAGLTITMSTVCVVTVMTMVTTMCAFLLVLALRSCVLVFRF